MSLEILARQNPWWQETATLRDDPALAEYDGAPFKWEPPYLRAPRSSKRVYFSDPLAFHSFRSWVFGYDHGWRATEEFLADPNNVGYLVESMIASHLQRNFGTRIFYWRNGQEIDFVVFREEKRVALIEVKYQTKINPDNAKALVQQGGGILLTKNQFLYNSEKNVLAIPVPFFLALLQD